MPQNLDSIQTRSDSTPLVQDSSSLQRDTTTLKQIQVGIDSNIVDSSQKANLKSKKVTLSTPATYIPTKQTELHIAADSILRDSINRAIEDIRFKLHTAYRREDNSNSFYHGIPKSNTNLNWSFLVLIFCLFLFAISKARFSKRLNLLFKSLKSWKFGKQIIRYERVYSHPTNIALLLIFLFSFSLFVQKVILAENFGNIAEIPFFFMLSIILVLYFFIKFLMFFSIGKIFGISEISNEYFFHILLFLKFSGVLLLPATLIYLYSSSANQLGLWLGISILIIAYFARIVRGVLIGLQANEKIYVIFLYLCSLEILPALVIGKFIKNMLIR